MDGMKAKSQADIRAEWSVIVPRMASLHSREQVI